MRPQRISRKAAKMSVYTGAMKIFEQFQTVAPMPDSTIARYLAELPAEIIDMWREHGIGFVGDGFLRVIDPVKFIDDDGVYLRSGVPIFVTALCDTIMYIPEALSFTAMKLRWGVMDIVSLPTTPLADALVAFGDPEYQFNVLESRHFREAAQRLGVPSFENGFNYVPMLALGGPHTSANLNEGLAVVSQALLVQAQSPQLRAYGPDQVSPREDYGSPAREG